MFKRIKAFFFINRKVKHWLDSYIDRGYINSYDYTSNDLYIHHLSGTNSVPIIGKLKSFNARVLQELFKIVILHT